MPSQLSHTLNVDEIIKYGENMLYEALNTNRLIAFVGSGISTAYGRCTWTEMLLDLIGAALQANEKNHKHQKDDNKLHNILERYKTRLENGQNCDSKEYPVILSLCESLFRLADPKKGDKKFRATVRKMVESHKYHTQQSLIKRYKVFSQFIDPNEFTNKETGKETNDIPSPEMLISKIETSENSPLFYEKHKLIKIKEIFKDEQKNLREIIFLQKLIEKTNGVKVSDNGINDNKTDDEKLLLRTDERNIFNIALFALHFCKAENDDNNIPGLAIKWHKELMSLMDVDLYDEINKLVDEFNHNKTSEDLKERLNKILATHGESEHHSHHNDSKKEKLKRYELARPTLDPLHDIYSTLSVNRFLTTNYDLEIERYLESLDFPIEQLTFKNDNEEKTEVRTKSRIGQEARSLSFIPHSAGDLMDFAVGAKEVSVDILHLHGRVNDGDNMVITEDDYQNYYVKPKKNQEHILNGLEVIWGGNPIVFMGVGLNEDDLLRPMRQFVSLKPKERRPVIAFMPNLNSNTADNKNKLRADILSMFVKYGVFELYYGDEKVAESGTEQQYPLTLGDEHNFIDAVKKYAITFFKETDATVNPSQNKGEEGSKTKCTEHPLTLALTNLFTHQSIDNKKIDEQKDEFLDAKKTLRDIQELFNNKKMQDNQNGDWEKSLKNLSRLFPRISAVNADFISFLYLICVFVEEAKCFHSKTATDLQTLVIEFLDGLKGKIITVAFKTYAENVVKGKRKWWQKWTQSLELRSSRPTTLELNEFYDSEEETKEEEKTKRKRQAESLKLLGRHMFKFPQPYLFNPVAQLFKPEPFLDIMKLWYDALNKGEYAPLVLLLKSNSGSNISHFLTWLIHAPAKPNLSEPEENDALLAVNEMKQQVKQHYDTFYIINTALSVEFLSVLDTIINIIAEKLIELLEWLNDKEKIEQINARLQQIEERLQKLEWLLELYVTQFELYKNSIQNNNDLKQPKRLAIFFAHFDTLLSEKVGLYSVTVMEFMHRFEQWAQKHRDCGIDFILIGNSVKLQRFAKKRLPLYYNKKIKKKDIKKQKDALVGEIKLTAVEESLVIERFMQIIDRLRTKAKQDFDSSSKKFEEFNQPGDEKIAANLQQVCEKMNYSYYAMMVLLGTIRFEFDLHAKEKALHISEEYQQWLQKLADEISHVHMSRRSTRIITQILFRYTSLERRSDNPAWRLEAALRLAILRYMSAIHSPIKVDVLIVAPEIAKIFKEHSQFLFRKINLERIGLKTCLNDELLGILRSELETDSYSKKQRLVLRNILEQQKKTPLSNEDLLSNQAISVLEKALIDDNNDCAKQLIMDCYHRFLYKIQRKLLTFAIQDLVNYHFVIDIISVKEETITDKEIHNSRYVLHRVMQEQIERIHGSKVPRRGERNFYDFNCLITTPRDMPFMDKDRYQFLTEYVDELISQRIAKLSLPQVNADRIRAAFSILRSHINLSILTRSELNPDAKELDLKGDNLLHDHQKRLRALNNAALELPKEIRQPLYVDEIAWLSNERGIFAYARGKFYQASPLFSLKNEQNPNFSHELSVRCGEQLTYTINQTLTMIERGALQESQKRLLDLKERMPKQLDFHHCACDGLLGRIYHIFGELNEAEKVFERAIKGFRAQNKIRTLAVFGRHYAQLLAVKGNTEKAKQILKEAISSAESTQQQDILHYCRFTEALMNIAGENVTENDRHFALIKLETAADYAEQMGLNELLVKTCFGRAQVLLATRQTKGASELAAKGLALATKHGMALLEAKGLVIYGNIATESGDTRTGKQLLCKGIKLAERIKYQTLVERAHQSLMAMDNNVIKRSFGDYGIKVSVNSYLGF